MRTLLLTTLLILLPVTQAGCECDVDAPATYQGAEPSGFYEGYNYQCQTYASRSCRYTLCQDTEFCGEWELESWYCSQSSSSRLQGHVLNEY